MGYICISKVLGNKMKSFKCFFTKLKCMKSKRMDPEIKAACIVGICTILGATLVGVSILVIMPNIPEVFSSNFSVEQYGIVNTSAKWEYEIRPEKIYIWDDESVWSSFNLDVDDINYPFDLSDYKGITFLIKAKRGGEFEFYLHASQSNDKYKRYSYWNKGSLRISTDWEKKEILFQDLQITPWTKKKYKAAPKNLNDTYLSNVFTIGFTDKTDGHIKNTVWIDEIELIHKNNRSKNIIISDFATFNVTINGTKGHWTTYVGYC